MFRTVLGGLAALALLMAAADSTAHGGGLNAEGCHNDRKNGGYHCHRAAASPPPANNLAPTRAPSQQRARESGAATYYANCSAARAAGAAPVRRGDPGYGGHLDRDGDGVGCE